MKHKKSAIIQTMDFLKTYWIQITAIVAGIAACSIFPFKLNAMESRQEKFEEVQNSLYEQTTQIGKWVAAQESDKAHEKELQASAPPGYRWDSLNREYVKI